MTIKADLQLSDNEKDQLINDLEREISVMETKYEAAKAERERLQNEQSELIKRLIQ